MMRYSINFFETIMEKPYFKGLIFIFCLEKEAQQLGHGSILSTIFTQGYFLSLVRTQ